MEEEVYKLVKANKIKISKEELCFKMGSHFAYPGLLSIKDTLDGLNINNSIYENEKRNLSEEVFPLIIHTTKDNGHLIYLESLAELHQQDLKNWSGIIIKVENTQQLDEETHGYKQEKIELNKILFFRLVAMALIATSILFGLSNKNYFNVSFMLLSIVGLGISYLIVQKELGISNKVTEKLCGTSKETDCNTVIKSKGSEFIWGLTWSDIGIVYFSSSLLLFFLSNFKFFNLTHLFKCISLAAFPFILYSLYYQWRVAKSWCRLCLIIVGILCLQAVTSLLAVNLPVSFSLLLEPLPIAIGMFTLIAYSWLLVYKPINKKAKAYQNKVLALSRFKFDPNTFINSLLNQNRLNIPSYTQHLELGNEQAAFQLLVVCNPYCAPCAKAHNELHNLLKHSANAFSLKVIFLTDAENKENAKTKAVQLMYDTIAQNGGFQNKELVREVVHLWYSNSNESSFKESFLRSPLRIKNYADNERLVQTPEIETIKDDWVQQIEFTPTLIINGYKLPQSYSIKEFTELFLPLINEEVLIHKLIGTELTI